MEHIVKQFDGELESIRTRLMEMGGRVEQQLTLALTAINDMDTAPAEKVLNDEEKIDQMEVDIDEDCILVIARRQPAASDLRLIISVTRAVRDLERIGDEAAKIVKHAIELVEQGGSPSGYTEVRHIGKAVLEMLHSSLDAFARFDADTAMDTIKTDRQIDQDYRTALRALMTYMMEDSRSIGRILNVIWVIRALERIGDHSKNLCEQIVYMVKGQDIRHLDDDAF